MATPRASCIICVTIPLLMLFVFVQPAVIPNNTESTKEPHFTPMSVLLEKANRENDDAFTTPNTLLSDQTTSLTTVDRTEVPTTSLVRSAEVSSVAPNPQELLIPPAKVNASIAQIHNTSYREAVRRFVYLKYRIFSFK